MRAASFLFALSSFACTQGVTSNGDAPPPATATEHASEPPRTESRARGRELGTIVTHDAKVSILSSAGDLRLVVRKADGAIVADGIPIDELRTTDPLLHTIVTSSVAKASPGTFLDATLEPTLRDPITASGRTR